MKNNTSFAVNGITYALMLSLAGAPAYAVDFNTDVLDAADRQNIDFSRFSQAGYILPGQYQMEIMVNDQGISTVGISGDVSGAAGFRSGRKEAITAGLSDAGDGQQDGTDRGFSGEGHILE